MLVVGLTVGGCSIPVPHGFQLPAAQRADATASYETWSYIVAPPRGPDWALSGASSLPDNSSLRCNPPAHVRERLGEVGNVTDELNFCIASGTAWEKMHWDEPSDFSYPASWGMTVGNLVLEGSSPGEADSVVSTRVAASISAAQNEAAPGTPWKRVDARIVQRLDGPYHLLHFESGSSEPPAWVALKVQRGLVLVLVSRDRPSEGNEGERVLLSLRAWASHHGVYWGFITDASRRPIESAIVAPGLSHGEARQHAPCTDGCGYSGPDGRYRLHVLLNVPSVQPPDLAFWLVASAPRSELRESVDTMPLPGAFGGPLDSVRVDFVLRR